MIPALQVIPAHAGIQETLRCIGNLVPDTNLTYGFYIFGLPKPAMMELEKQLMCRHKGGTSESSTNDPPGPQGAGYHL